MSTMNCYVVLGIAEDADGDEIRSAFRALARRYHPDAGNGSSPAEFRRALEAYETLSDPERRRIYDRTLRGSRARPTTIAEPIGPQFSAEPLFPSSVFSRAFPGPRAPLTRPATVDALFDELLRSISEEWFWRWLIR